MAAVLQTSLVAVQMPLEDLDRSLMEADPRLDPARLALAHLVEATLVVVRSVN